MKDSGWCLEYETTVCTERKFLRCTGEKPQMMESCRSPKNASCCIQLSSKRSLIIFLDFNCSDFYFSLRSLGLLSFGTRCNILNNKTRLRRNHTVERYETEKGYVLHEKRTRVHLSDRSQWTKDRRFFRRMN